MPRSLLCFLLPLGLILAGCDQISALDGSKAREADGVAIGSACRQAGRAIEDCFTMNPEASKSSVFAGWKEMNDYMVANKLETVAPQVPRPDAAKESAKGEAKDGAKKADAHGAGDGHGAPTAAAGATATAAAPGVPPVPATVNIPGLNAGTAAPPAATAPPAAAPAPERKAAAGLPPAIPSIALGGQTIPLSLPPATPSATPTTPSVPPANH